MSASDDEERALEPVWVTSSLGGAVGAGPFAPVHLQVYGEAGSSQLAALAGLVQHLYRRRPALLLRAPSLLPLYEAEWTAFVDNLRKLVSGGETWCLSGSAVLFCDSQYVGDLEHAVDWMMDTFRMAIDLEQIEPPADIYRQTMFARKNSVVFLDVAYDGRAVGRLVFELYDQLLPRASHNFRQLCAGSSGVSEHTGTVLWYAGTPVHRIVRGGWLQAGDIVDGCGAHGESVYGATFADECFAVAHDRRGRLSMVQDERNTNASQFMVSFGAMTYMQNFCCAFGQLIEGSAVLSYLETVETNNERPTRTVSFTNGGVLHEPSRADRLPSVDLCEADLADWSPPQPHVRREGTSLWDGDLCEADLADWSPPQPHVRREGTSLWDGDLCEADLADWSPPQPHESDLAAGGGGGGVPATALDYIVPVGHH